jgi:hypothetical protein
MRIDQKDAVRRADLRDALVYAGFALLLLTLLAVMLWLSGMAHLDHVEVYIGATVLVGSICAFRAESAWKHAKRIARRSQPVEEKREIPVLRKVATPKPNGVSWAKRIHEDS